MPSRRPSPTAPRRSSRSISATGWRTWIVSSRSPGATTSRSSRTARTHGQRWRDRGAGCIGEFGSFSHQSSKILTAGEGGSLLTNDEPLARRAHSIVDCGRPKDEAEIEVTFGANYRLGELHAALLGTQLERFKDQRVEREANARFIEEIAEQVPGVHIRAADERIRRWSFHNYLLRIDPDKSA
jgi:dTDP-4-amino-4,6-dideoxygalactose transaminase